MTYIGILQSNISMHPKQKRYYSRRQGILPLLSLPGRRLGLLELVALLSVQRLELLLVLRLEVVHGRLRFEPKRGKNEKMKPDAEQAGSDGQTEKSCSH